jgi:hypothetical protein
MVDSPAHYSVQDYPPSQASRMSRGDMPGSPGSAVGHIPHGPRITLIQPIRVPFPNSERRAAAKFTPYASFAGN